MILSNDLIPTKNLLVSRWLNVEHPRFRVMYHTVRIFVSELSGACVRCSCAGALLCPSWRGHVFLPYPFISSTVLRIHLSRFISDIVFHPYFFCGACTRAGCSSLRTKYSREISAEHVHLPGLRRRFDSIRCWKPLCSGYSLVIHFSSFGCPAMWKAASSLCCKHYRTFLTVTYDNTHPILSSEPAVK
jgi:hypothetical protein